MTSRKNSAPAEGEVCGRKAVATRQDGWGSVMTGLNGKKDKIASMKVMGQRLMSDQEITNWYSSDGTFASVVDQVAEDMIQGGFEVARDDGRIYKYLRVIGFPKAVKTALSASRLYGGSILVMDFEKEGFDRPLDRHSPNPKGRLRGFRVFPRSRIKWHPEEAVTNPDSPYFEDFESFEVMKQNGRTFRVHASKCFVFKGCPVMDPTMVFVRPEYKYWGTPLAMRVRDASACYGSFIQGIGNLGQELVIGKYKLSNLEQLVAEGNWRAIDTRMSVIDSQKSILNGVLLGESEEYTRDSVNLGGADKCIQMLMMNYSSCVRIPVTKLFGQAATGTNATGQGDEKDYNKYIKDGQENELLPVVVSVVKVVNSQLHVLTGDDADMPDITFNTLFHETDRERAETKKMIAEADTMYANLGVLGTDEIRSNRFGGGYSQETDVDGKKMPKLTVSSQQPNDRVNPILRKPRNLGGVVEGKQTGNGEQ